MPKSQSLDELISRKAAEFAEHVRNAAQLAANEEEIKMEVEKQLAFIQKEAGIKLEVKYEFTVAEGRADSVYTRVIIEYKNPKSAADRVGPKPDSPGTKKVVDQIKRRFQGLRDEHGHPLNSLFGVGLDGLHFVFVRFREGKWDVQDPVEVTRYSTERFLWALFNLGHKGKAIAADCPRKEIRYCLNSPIVYISTLSNRRGAKQGRLAWLKENSLFYRSFLVGWVLTWDLSGQVNLTFLLA